MAATTETKAQAIARADRNEKKATRLAAVGKNTARQAAENWEQILQGAGTYATSYAAGVAIGRFGEGGKWTFGDTDWPVIGVLGGVAHLAAAIAAGAGWDHAAGGIHAVAKGAIATSVGVYGVQQGAAMRAKKIAAQQKAQHAALLQAQAQAQAQLQAQQAAAAEPTAETKGLSADEALASYFATAH